MNNKLAFEKIDPLLDESEFSEDTLSHFIFGAR